MRKWHYDCGFLYKNNICFYDNLTKMIVGYDINNNSFQHFSKYESEKIIDPIENYFETSNGIYAVEMSGNRILHIFPTSGKIEVIRINAGSKSWGNFPFICHILNNIYIFKSNGEIIVFDTNSDSFELTYCPGGVGMGCLMDDTICIFDSDIKHVHCLDVISEKWITYDIEWGLDKRVVYAEYTDEKSVILMNNYGDYCEFDPSDHFKTLDLFKSNQNLDAVEFCVCKNSLVSLPMQGEDIFIVDRKEKNVKALKDYPEDFCYDGPKEWCKYYWFNDIGEKRFYAMRRSNYILIINKCNGEISFRKPVLNDKNQDAEFIIRNNELLTEGDIVLEDFLSYLDCTL